MAILLPRSRMKAKALCCACCRVMGLAMIGKERTAHNSMKVANINLIRCCLIILEYYGSRFSLAASPLKRLGISTLSIYCCKYMNNNLHNNNNVPPNGLPQLFIKLRVQGNDTVPNRSKIWRFLYCQRVTWPVARVRWMSMRRWLRLPRKRRDMSRSAWMKGPSTRTSSSRTTSSRTGSFSISSQV